MLSWSYRLDPNHTEHDQPTTAILPMALKLDKRDHLPNTVCSIFSYFATLRELACKLSTFIPHWVKLSHRNERPRTPNRSRQEKVYSWRFSIKIKCHDMTSNPGLQGFGSKSFRLWSSKLTLWPRNFREHPYFGVFSVLLEQSKENEMDIQVKVYS